MIRLEVFPETPTDHFLVRGDEPFRIEVMGQEGTVMAHVYRGDATDTEQEPIGCYDGTLPENTPWVSLDHTTERLLEACKIVLEAEGNTLLDNGAILSADIRTYLQNLVAEVGR